MDLLARIRAVLSGELNDKVFFAMAGLLVKDVRIVSDWEFHVNIKQNKTDPMRKGVTVAFYANGSASCPFQAFINDYWLLLGERPSMNAPLFVWQDGSVVNRAEASITCRKVGARSSY